jgi:hypothetical protein
MPQAELTQHLAALRKLFKEASEMLRKLSLTGAGKDNQG